MKRNVFAVLLVLVLTVTMAACGAGEETTLTGMVVSVDGTVISLMEMDTANMGGKDFAEGERPERPEGTKGSGLESFDPETSDATLPNGETMPQRGDKERPEKPEGDALPEDMTAPEDGQMTAFDKEDRFEKFTSDAETKDVDIGNAHISLEEDGVKASGSMDDIKKGAFVTITMNGKGEVTNVLVTATSGFGRGDRRPTN